MTNNNWKERFDEEFICSEIDDSCDGRIDTDIAKKIKSFIEKELQAERERIYKKENSLWNKVLTKSIKAMQRK